MKILIFFALLSLGLISEMSIAENLSQPLGLCAVSGKVIKVTDGDTVKVLDSDNATHTIRLAGIDAPERKQAYGKAAGKYLAKQVNQKQVCIAGNKLDRYRRLVGVIWYQGRDVNLSMVSAGYAWHYKKYQLEQSPDDRALYAKAEVQAKSDVVGLWSEPNPITPSDWRKGVRTSKSTVSVLTENPITPEHFSCDSKRFCKQMTSCREACFYLETCNISRLDGNHDGIPCNQQCDTSCP
ncbi:thermonuclease family protein [Leucothrix mucor]|uniref:thermonuclease family protein n=1 Tax=Leucothrix mucor TaxID=45248 RepID=UPI0003B50E57|nr:thermonuclease family protein [Leucothrix mucor]